MDCNYGDRIASGQTPAQALRRILESPGIHQGPICYNALSAKLVQRAGFPFALMGGFAVSAARLGLPDVEIISYGEMLDQGFQITQAVSIPVIGDADTGYGCLLNVKRTVKGFIRAGFAGILLEDQLSPKACGHTRGRKVVSREEAIMRIKAAIDARKESGSDIVILARTDSRQAVSIEEALWRSRAFADAGADALFIDALASIDEMKAFCQISPLVPKMANMQEGGGKTPILSPAELQEIGYKIVVYPMSLIGVSMRAMKDALIALKGGRIPPPEILPSFEEIMETVGFKEYYEEEERYKIGGVLPSYGGGPAIQEEAGESAYKSSDSPTLRLKVTGSNGFEKLDARISAGFFEGMANIIPDLGGVNVMELLENASLESAPEKGKLLLDFNGTLADRIQMASGGDEPHRPRQSLLKKVFCYKKTVTQKIPSVDEHPDSPSVPTHPPPPPPPPIHSPPPSSVSTHQSLPALSYYDTKAQYHSGVHLMYPSYPPYGSYTSYLPPTSYTFLTHHQTPIPTPALTLSPSAEQPPSLVHETRTLIVPDGDMLDRRIVVTI